MYAKSYESFEKYNFSNSSHVLCKIYVLGRDGTRGYVTGEFNDKGLIEDISGFTLSQIHSVNHWLQFYMKDYTFKGIYNMNKDHILMTMV